MFPRMHTLRYSALLFKEFLTYCNLLNFFKLLVSQKNNVGGWVGGCMHACVRACVCVCTLLLLSIFLAFERFLAPCFTELLMFYC